MNYLENYKNYLRLRNLAPITIEQYTKIVNRFLKYTKGNPILATSNDIIKFALQENSAKSKQQTIGALKHFYVGVLNKPQTFKFIPSVKQTEFVPEILTKEEVQQLLDSTKNLKHKAMLSLLYYGALRRSELLNLKIEQIHKDQTLRVVQGKGRKDRVVPIPETCLHVLRIYYKKYRPDQYLFNGQASKKYSPMSLNKVLQKNLKHLNLTKHIRLHDIRHSRATHLLESGVDIEFIRQLLGHKRLTTTQRYLHISTQSLKTAILCKP